MRVIIQTTDESTKEVTNTPQPWTAEGLKAYIAERRYERETGGITVGTQVVTTNRDEMPIWQGMLLDIVLQPGQRMEFEYKPRGGANTTLTLAQVQRCYACFAWHVAACFATERALNAMIDGGADLDAIAASIDSAWQQNTFEWEAPE